MMKVRKSAQRGGANHGWLNTKHTFSFADYFDPQYLGFRSLRVLNEDEVLPGRGFGEHSHQDMEIISYVLAGQLAHHDSLGNGGLIAPGEVQRMSAGTGVRHAEQNASKTQLVHFLQIWIEPDRAGHAPSYEQRRFGDDEKRGRLRLIASPDGSEGSVRLNADVRLYACLLAKAQPVLLPLAPGRHAWVQVARGEVNLNGQALEAGDGAALSGEAELRLEGILDAEVLLFDLP